MERKLSELVERLKKAHGERLVSVVLYGSAAAEEGLDRLSDFNVLCILREVSVDELAAAEPVFRWWREMRNPAPVLLSLDEVRTSSDCFPIEFHDIRERRRVLHGEDVFRDLAIDTSFYRAHVEYELRAKLLRLRQKAGGLLSDADLLLRLMADSLSTFCVLFRHAMLLRGNSPTFGKRQVMQAAAVEFGIDVKPFEQLIDLREGKLQPKQIKPAALFPEYLKQINVVLDAVDRMEK